MISLKNVFSALIPLFLLSVIFTGCEKEALEELAGETTETEGRTSNNFSNTTANEGDCFTIVYPVELNFEDGTMTMVNSNEELETAIANWYETQGEDAEDPSPTYPVTVILEDGTEQMLQSDEELEALFDDCFGEEDDEDGDDDDEEDEDGECFDDQDDFEDCFTINFPISFELPDGSTTTVNNDEELNDFFDRFEDENEDEDEEEDEEEEEEEDDFTLVYPISVTMIADGAVVTLNSDDEIDDLLDSCE